jgi:hypothetical protein
LSPARDIEMTMLDGVSQTEIVRLSFPRAADAAAA